MSDNIMCPMQCSSTKRLHDVQIQAQSQKVHQTRSLSLSLSLISLIILACTTPRSHVNKALKFHYSRSIECSSAKTVAFVPIFFICVSSSFSPPANRISRSSMARIFFCKPLSFLAFGLPPPGLVTDNSGVWGREGLIERLPMVPEGG